MTLKRMDNVLIVVDDIEAAKAFFIELGLTLEGEQTVEGPLIGLKDVRATGQQYHLELTAKRGHSVGRAPTLDNLLVFYVPDVEQWRVAVERMRSCGYEPVESFNPYWDRQGKTFEDADGYRVVLQNAEWSV
jgi:catechol 2,3-dioxygenase-like lactoylglutathione lyase family enzyme